MMKRLEFKIDFVVMMKLIKLNSVTKIGVLSNLIDFKNILINKICPNKIVILYKTRIILII